MKKCTICKKDVADDRFRCNACDIVYNKYDQQFLKKYGHKINSLMHSLETQILTMEVDYAETLTRKEILNNKY